MSEPIDKDKLEAAVNVVYEARKTRRAYPKGDCDSGGRWFPSVDENADGFTASIRPPSRSWPYSYMRAACSRRHVEALADVNPGFLLRLAEEISHRL